MKRRKKKKIVRRPARSPAARPRKTIDEYEVQGNYGYGHGFEVVTTEETLRGAKAQLRAYRENEPGVPFRIKHKQLRVQLRLPGVRDPSKAPHGPASGFGKEKSVSDIRARIAWEKWAANRARKAGHEAIAQGHDLARVSYEELLQKKSHGALVIRPLRGRDPRARGRAATRRRRPVSRSPSSVNPLSDPRYFERFKFPKWNRLVNVLDEHRLFPRVFPELTKEDHKRLARFFAEESGITRRKWEATVTGAARKYGEHGSLISGVYREHFPERVKTKLRHLAHGASQFAQASVSHWQASGARTPWRTTELYDLAHWT